MHSSFNPKSIIFIIAGAFALICIIAGVYTLIRKSNKNNPNKIHVFKPMVITGLAFLFGIFLYKAGTHIVIEINSGEVIAGVEIYEGNPYLDQHVAVEHGYPHYQSTQQLIRHHQNMSSSIIGTVFAGWAIIFSAALLIGFIFSIFYFKWYKSILAIGLMVLLSFLTITTLVRYNMASRKAYSHITAVQAANSPIVAPTPQQIQLTAEEITRKNNKSFEEKVEDFVENVEKKADDFSEAVENNVEKIEKQVEAKIAEIEKKTEEIVNKAATVKAKAKAIKKKAEAKAKKPSTPIVQKTSPEPVVSPRNKTESDSENLPEWTKLEKQMVTEGNTFFVRSEQFATKEEALQDALNRAKYLIFKRHWPTHDTVNINQSMILVNKMHTEIIQRKTGDHEFKVYRVYLETLLNPLALKKQIKAIQQAKVNFRVMILSEIVAAAFLLLIIGMIISNGKLKKSRKVQT